MQAKANNQILQTPIKVSSINVPKSVYYLHVKLNHNMDDTVTLVQLKMNSSFSFKKNPHIEIIVFKIYLNTFVMLVNLI